MTPESHPPDKACRTWYCTHEAEGHVRATVFLVDAPITFGHSQLRVGVPEGTPEESAFAKAAGNVAKCIHALSDVLPGVVSEFAYLAGYTDTTGPYIKTAVLKASARESECEYKVHLVPLFQSHLEAMRRLNQKTQHLGEPKEGGMLHWLGRCEARVDWDAGMRESSTYRERVTAFRLDELACKLRRSMEAP